MSFLFTFVFNWRLRGFCWKTEVAENVGQEFCFRALTLVFDKVLKTRDFFNLKVRSSTSSLIQLKTTLSIRHI